MRLLMLGLDAGKATVVKKFNGQDIDLIHRRSASIETLEYRGFKLNIWDVGGQGVVAASTGATTRQTMDSQDRRLGGPRAAARLGRSKRCSARVRTPRRLAALLAANARLLPCDARAPQSRRRVSTYFRQQTGPRGALRQTRYEQSYSSTRSKRTGESKHGACNDGLASGVDWIVRDIANRIFMHD